MMGWALTFHTHHAAPSPLVGEGWGGGSESCGPALPYTQTPTPDPSPPEGGERTGHGVEMHR